MSVAVIGAVFMDLKAFAGENYDPHGRNVGSIRITHGGVGRNVAENIGRLGCHTSFISGVDASPLADSVLSRLDDAEVDTSKVLKGSDMGIWSVILDKNGDVLGSISHPPETSAFDKYFDEISNSILSSSDLIAIEIDYSKAAVLKTLETAEKLGKKVFGVVANLDVVLDIPEYLNKFEFIICNDIEIGKILGIETEGLDPEPMIDIVVPEMEKRGFRKLIVTLGEKGAVYLDSDRSKCFHVPALKADVVDTTGAGDAFFSGVVASLDKGFDIHHALVVGTRLASLTICTNENNCIPPQDIFCL